MNKKLLQLYGLKFNPFSPEIPTEAVRVSPAVESFLWKLEQALAREGGFALITGEPGTGKSVTLRLVAERLSTQPELVVGVISRPQANVADFYRELGEAFQVDLRPHNRWPAPDYFANDGKPTSKPLCFYRSFSSMRRRR